MKSKTLGGRTSITEVTHAARLGMWLCVDTEEHLKPFDCFSWFRDATIWQVSQVERVGQPHFHWPLLDADTIDHPEEYSNKMRIKRFRNPKE